MPLPNSDIRLMRVKQNGLLLATIKDQTPEIQMSAVSNNGLSLLYVDEKEQTIELCLAAFLENGQSIGYIQPHLIGECIKRIRNGDF